MQIMPAIIPESYEDLEEKLAEVKGLASMVQVDIVDGQFAPEASWPFADSSDGGEFQRLVSQEKGLPFWKEFDFEVDLMIEQPEKNIEDWVQAGFARIIVHFESTEKLDEIIEALEGRAEIGLALDIETLTEAVMPFVQKVDFIQCMGIAQIGSQGQVFDERVIPKIKAFKSQAPDVIIAVDGGVDPSSARELKVAGADRLVSGSAIFEADEPKAMIETLKNPS